MVDENKKKEKRKQKQTEMSKRKKMLRKITRNEVKGKRFLKKSIDVEQIKKEIKEKEKKEKHIRVNYDWLIDFNGMSTHLGLFYASRLENCIHYTFIVTYSYVVGS